MDAAKLKWKRAFFESECKNREYLLKALLERGMSEQ